MAAGLFMVALFISEKSYINIFFLFCLRGKCGKFMEAKLHWHKFAATDITTKSGGLGSSLVSFARKLRLS